MTVDLKTLTPAQPPKSWQDALSVYSPLLLPGGDPAAGSTIQTVDLARIAGKGAPTPAQEVVGLLLGSPEFQRR